MLLRRRAVVGSAVVLALGGCGFALRRTPEMPFRTLALAGFAPASPLAAELRRSIGGRVAFADTQEKADVVLRALVDSRERSVVASTAAAQVRQMQLRLRFRFQIEDAAGRELTPPTELLLVRDMNYSETAALAKAQEEEQLYAAMQSDIAQQVARRLAQLDPAQLRSS